MATASKSTTVRAWAGFFRHIPALLAVPAPAASRLLHRLKIMELVLMLPLKAAGIAILFHSFYFSPSPWIRLVADTLSIAVESTQYFFWLYVSLNIVVAGVLFGMRWLPLALVQWTAFTISLVDGIFLAALTVVTGGYESILFWLYVALILRNAVSFPPAMMQVVLNTAIIICYVMGGAVYAYVVGDLPEDVRRALDPAAASFEAPTELVVLGGVLLLLLAVCSYALQVLVEQQRQAAEEAREFALREAQLRSAGRLAAEFAHQIKNPLAIINNAAFSLQRGLKEGKADPREQIRIIQEEVERSDRIITQIMGYGQLSEGKVEKLDALDELENAIARVFPPAAGFPVHIHRDFQRPIPPLLMQRGHLADVFANILQNAREAMRGAGGNVWVRVRRRSDLAIEVSIRDDGPGIAPDKLSRVFEAYYTTKDKGTGLGLATVKHNVELYGGTVGAESELGKGASFVLIFPARTLIKLANQTNNRE
jgi:signal transduction histidine kinase